MFFLLCRSYLDTAKVRHYFVQLPFFLRMKGKLHVK